jgi:hypothetical protein
MKRLLIVLVCLAWSFPVLAQNADEPASRDDVILYLRTMHSHDMMMRVMQIQSKAMQQMLHDQFVKKGNLPADFDARMAKRLDELIKGMPVDEMTQAMIPAYQNHFTKGDITAMNTFYSSPVGQKVLEQLPAVMQEGMQAAMPVISQYLSDWQERVKHDFDEPQKSAPAKADENAPPAQN